VLEPTLMGSPSPLMMPAGRRSETRLVTEERDEVSHSSLLASRAASWRADVPLM